MTYLEDERLKLIYDILGEKINSSRAFMQYMDSVHEYGPADKLHMREAHFIMALGLGEGKSMSEVAKEMCVTQGAVSQTAGRLEKKGYIKRQRDSENYKQVIAILTEKGRIFYNQHLEFDSSEYAKMDRDYLFRFSEEELHRILEYEKQMTAIFSDDSK